MKQESGSKEEKASLIEAMSNEDAGLVLYSTGMRAAKSFSNALHPFSNKIGEPCETGYEKIADLTGAILGGATIMSTFPKYATLIGARIIYDLCSDLRKRALV